MKKFIAIISAIIFAISLTACSSSTNYKYADNWDTEIVCINSNVADFKEKYFSSAEKYNDLLDSIKGVIEESVPYPELLDWDKFNQLKTVKRMSSIPSDMSYEEAYFVVYYTAIYDNEEDCIYLLPQFDNSSEKAYALIHEIIHSLVPNYDGEDDSQLAEGAVDWLASVVCSENGFTIDSAYDEQILCLKVLMNIYGEERVLRAICEDNIANLIDSSTEPGMTEKLNKALATAHSTKSSASEVKNAVHAELDILAHAAKQKEVNISKWFDYIAVVYKGVNIKLDVNYFKNL